jgi:hypothetical protein
MNSSDKMTLELAEKICKRKFDQTFGENCHLNLDENSAIRMYKQQIDLSKNQFVVVESDYGAFEETVYGGDIIFDNKYGNEYYKYLNKTLFDEINLSSNKFYSNNSNYTQTDNPLLPSTGISTNYNLNPLMLLFLCVISFKNVI